MDGARAHNAHVVISVFCLKDTVPSVTPQPGLPQEAVGGQGRAASSICPQRCHRDRLNTQRCLQEGVVGAWAQSELGLGAGGRQAAGQGLVTGQLPGRTLGSQAVSPVSGISILSPRHVTAAVESR